jgi:uroporphyrinogen decarboxylase
MKTHRERIETCLSNQTPDRPPVALWRHFPVDDQTPEGLAQATVAFQHDFDFDLIKVSPSSSYCLKDWGVEDEWRGDPEGTRDYTKKAIHNPEDWERLSILDPRKGNLNSQLQCLRLLEKEISAETPIIQTIFNPLAQAKNLSSDGNLLVYMRRYPQALHAGLKTITETTINFIEEMKKIRIAGIFYAVQHAQYSLLTLEEYRLFGRAYDLQILEATRGLWLKILHLHGKDVMFDKFIDYPVEVINWHDRETSPSIGEGKNLFKNAVCGGIQRDTMVLGTPDQVKREAREAIEATSGKRLILGTGCVVPITAPRGNILAIRQLVE